MFPKHSAQKAFLCAIAGDARTGSIPLSLHGAVFMVAKEQHPTYASPTFTAASPGLHACIRNFARSRPNSVNVRKMDVDNLIAEINQHNEEADSTLQSLRDALAEKEQQLQALIQLITEKDTELESQRRTIERYHTDAVTEAKHQLRSETERKLREKLVEKMRDEIRAELLPQIKAQAVTECRDKVMSRLSDEQIQRFVTPHIEARVQTERKAIEQSLRDALEPEIQTRVGVALQKERQVLRSKLAEVSKIKEGLSDSAVSRANETKLRTQIASLEAKFSREVLAAKKDSNTLRKRCTDFEGITAQLKNELAGTKADSQEQINRLREQITFKDKEIKKLQSTVEHYEEDHRHRVSVGVMTDPKPKRETRDAAIRTSPVISKDVETIIGRSFAASSISNSARVLPVSQHIQDSPSKEEYDNDASFGASAPPWIDYSREPSDPAANYEEPKSPPALENCSVNRNVATPQTNVEDTHSPIFECAGLQTGTSEFLVKEKLIAHFEHETAEQARFVSSEPLALPSGKAGSLLQSAIQYLFKLWDHIEEAFTTRNRILTTLRQFIRINALEPALKAAQQELIRCRKIDNERHHIYEVIRRRELQKAGNIPIDGVNAELHQLFLSQPTPILYRGIDYALVLQAESDIRNCK